jgi:single-strand DNA-binding protein
MPNFENHVIVGHVGKVNGLQYSQNGTAMASFSVAVNNPRRKDDPPTWYRANTFGQTAEFVNQYVKQGVAILVSGDRLELSEWTAQDGTVRHTLELHAQTVQLLGGKRDGQEQPADSEPLPF